MNSNFRSVFDQTKMAVHVHPEHFRSTYWWLAYCTIHLWIISEYYLKPLWHTILSLFITPRVLNMAVSYAIPDQTIVVSPCMMDAQLNYIRLFWPKALYCCLLNLQAKNMDMRPRIINIEVMITTARNTGVVMRYNSSLGTLGRPVVIFVI